MDAPCRHKSSKPIGTANCGCGYNVTVYACSLMHIDCVLKDVDVKTTTIDGKVNTSPEVLKCALCPHNTSKTL
jgi:hypothetical protein